MSKTAIFMADGVEEIEALTVVDLLRRAKEEIVMVNIHDTDKVVGSHNIVTETDQKISEFNPADYDAVVLPGGLRGHQNLKANDKVIAAVKEMAAAGKLVTAICAAPTVLGYAGVLEGKKAICYPGMEDGLTGAVVTTEEVVCDGNIITSRGMGTAIPFGLAIIEYLQDKNAADEMAAKIVFRQ